MISTEEVHILKALISENISIKRGGYIDHILFENLKNNFLILVENEEYYIPKDILNCIKMAINLYNEEIYSLKDITDSLLIGLIRVNNVLSITETLDILKMHRCIFTSKSLKDYIKTNPRLKNVINITDFQDKLNVQIIKKLYEELEKGNSNTSQILDKFEEENIISHLTEIMAYDFEITDVDKAVEDLINIYEKEKLVQRRNVILKQLENSCEENISQLEKELNEVILKLAKMK